MPEAVTVPNPVITPAQPVAPAWVPDPEVLSPERECDPQKSDVWRRIRRS